MSKSVLVIDTPENCYDCPFGTEYCGELEYVGYCELADCLDYDVILMTEEHYDCESKSRPDWCPLKPLPEKLGCFHSERSGKSPSYDIGGMIVLMRLKEE